MSNIFPSEHPPHIHFKELTHQQEQHLRQQIYYFTPFVRGLYHVLVKEKAEAVKSISPAVLGDLKALTIYYADAFLNGDFDIDAEQKLVDNIYKTIGLPLDAVREKIKITGANAFNKTDG